MRAGFTTLLARGKLENQWSCRLPDVLTDRNRERGPDPRDQQESFDCRNHLLQASSSGKNWTVENMQRASAIRAPAFGHVLLAADGRSQLKSCAILRYRRQIKLHRNDTVSIFDVELFKARD